MQARSRNISFCDVTEMKLPFEKVNARGGIWQGAFSLTNKSRAFSLTRRTQNEIKFLIWGMSVGR